MRSHTRITIVGGGIAGLTLATALDPRRFEVTVLEAEPDRASVGGALTLWPAAVRALRRLGAGELVDRHTIHVDNGTVRDLRTGRPLLPTGSARLTIVPRPELLAALESRLPATVRRERTLVEDPRWLDGHLVVGADGVRSRVRGLVHPGAAERLATPYLALRGMSQWRPEHDAVGEYWGSGGLFGLVPLREGAYWFTTHRSTLAPEPIDPEVALAEVREEFRDAAPPVTRVLAGAGADRVLATRLWVAPALPRYASGRYVVIGDAAHAMTPNLGRGACDAIVDAVTLAAALGSPAGFALWQARRLAVTQAARVASGGLMRLALSGQPQRMLRIT